MTGSPHSRDSFSSPLQVSLVIIEGRPRRLRLVLIRLKTRWGSEWLSEGSLRTVRQYPSEQRRRGRRGWVATENLCRSGSTSEASELSWSVTFTTFLFLSEVRYIIRIGAMAPKCTSRALSMTDCKCEILPS